MYRSLIPLLLLCFTSLGLGAAAHAAGVPIPKPPSVDAGAYILIDYQSGRVLAEKNADQRMAPASLTKLMTAYVVFSALKSGSLKLTDKVTVSEHAWREVGSRTFLKVGSHVSVDNLIKGMIVQSGNDATVALAERVGGTEQGFVQIMNEFARRLGMRHTHFADSNGLPNPDHYTTARDLATLTRALIREFPQYYHYFSIRQFTWNHITQRNRNGLLWRDPSIDGLKTGHTESAGYCLVTSANRDGMRLISVVMDSSSVKGREDSSATLLNYGYTFYRTLKVQDAGKTVLMPRVYESANKMAPIGIRHTLYVTVGRSEAGKLRTTTKVQDPLVAPLPAGKKVGALTVKASNGDVVAQVPLVTLKAVPLGGLWTRAVDSVALWFD